MLLLCRSVATHKINEAGQFIIGATKQINYANTLDFIANNRQQAERMYKEYTEYTVYLLYYIQYR